MVEYALAARLRAARKHKGWTQRELATRSGIHSVLISKLERGKTQHGMNTDTLRELCKALGTSTDYLLGLSEESTNAPLPLDAYRAQMRALGITDNLTRCKYQLLEMIEALETGQPTPARLRIVIALSQAIEAIAEAQAEEE